jgi:uncharacterized protein YyaL (SSP411 family)
MNRLAGESSPYLRQHADNPVDWYPWTDEAFAAARQDDKPILLSVGYSSCHWCHVMAHESFEDPDVAALMNDVFVNIKVDREERPDVDALYMEAVQTLSGHGGWPMTVFLTSDGQPFFAGTYFPKTPRGGMMSFPELCQRIDELWRTRRDDLETQAGQLTAALGRAARLLPGDGIPGAEVLDTALDTLASQHDDRWGGFGQAPKFPQAMSHEVILRALARAEPGDTAAEPLRTQIETSLDAMASGGMYDHLGGGFARYSVDTVWLVPHFEKMLYDQALLTRLYLHAWQITGHDRYLQVVDETVAYVLRDLRHASGGFLSAEDADSEGEEGRFYVWSPDEIAAVLGDDALAREVTGYYGVTPEGNFERTGRSILNRIHARGELARPPHVEQAREALFAAREKRVRPGLDDKVLTEWNGLMLSALAEAAAATGRSDWLDAAVANGEFLLASLRRPDGRWLRSWQATTGANHLAYAADHGALIDAFVRLAEATGEARWVDEARTTADGLLDLFWDPERGGVLTTGSDAERLVAPTKDLMDNATPGANSLATVGLLRLAALTGEATYRDRAEDILRLIGPLAAEHPTAFGHLLYALDLAVRGIDEVVVAGDRPDLVEAVRRRFTPNAVLAWGERYDSPLWEGRTDGRAYVCRSYACQLPAADPEALLAQLS